MKLTKQQGCFVNDLIDINLCPLDVEKLFEHFRDMSEKSADFFQQERWHEFYYIFKKAYWRWEKKRNQIDRQEVRK